VSLKAHDTVYEPVFLDITVNEWLYQVITFSVSPGRRIGITLTERAQTVDQAISKARALLAYINP
jgi:hypothetical protein